MNRAVLLSLFLLWVVPMKAHAQVALFQLGIEFDGCGTTIAADPGTIVELSGFTTLSTPVPGVTAVNQSVELFSLGDVESCIDVPTIETCGELCKEALFGVDILDVLGASTSFVIQNEDGSCENGVGDSDDEVNLGRRGFVDSTILEVGRAFPVGVTRTLPFTIRVQMPDFPATIPIHINYVDGLRALGLSVTNGVSFNNETIGFVPDSLGRFISSEGCFFNLTTSAGELGLQPGDANQDREVDFTDGIWLLRFVILGDPNRAPCADGSPQHASNLALLDTNGSGAIDVTDAIHFLAWVFLGGPPHVGGLGCAAIPQCPPTCFVP